MYFLEQLDCFARLNADRTAIVDRGGGRATTYGQLNDLSGRIAAKLAAGGLGPGCFVVLGLDRSMEYVAAWIGAMKAGCAAVPVVRSYPTERIEYIRKDCGAALVMDEGFLTDIGLYEPMAPVAVPDSAPALVIYTSGSTGKPKGILHSRGALEAAIDREMSMFDGLDELCLGCTAPMSFIVFIFEYPGVLKRGGTSHIISEATRRDIRRMMQYYDDHQISAAFIAPQMFRFYRGSRGMKRVFTGSERLTGVYSDRFEIINGYGMSETLAAAVSFRVDRKYDNTPIGKPMKGVELFLLDEDGRAVPTAWRARSA